jgi:predicted nucleic acid-binding Zn ribbon protein
VTGDQHGSEDIHRRQGRNTGGDPELPTEARQLSTGKANPEPDTQSEHGPDRDLASGALRSARAMSAGRATGRPARLRRGRRSGGGYSGARPDELDPAPIGSILGSAMAELGWVAPLAHARVMGQWASVVGADIAARCQPVSLADGELRVAAESTAWATQLRLMTPQLLARITRELPAGLVTKLVITGPSVPSWKRGPWSMHGGRGVRDTYG